MPDSAVSHQMHSMQTNSGIQQEKGGSVYIYNRWCSDVQIISKHCTTDAEVLLVKCRPLYLLREFSAVFILAAYIPLHTNVTTALKLLHDIINTHTKLHIPAVLPMYHQHVKFPTRKKNNMKGAYRAVPWPHFGQSGHTCFCK